MDLRFILSPTCPTAEAEDKHPQYPQHASTTYHYTPLQHPDEIRLLILEPGRPSEAVKCNLVHTRLSHTPSYEALSYTWGTEERPSQIFCGQDGHISVTQNCLEAIKSLRYKDRERVTWIDAVCIDQPSIAERGHQVAIMPSIYRQARKVIVYLGECTEDSGLAMEYLKSHQFINDDATSFSPSQSQLALGRLISRPWFSRLWVLQEIFMSASADVICGHKSVPWACFRRLAKWNPQNAPQKIPLVMSVNSYRNAKDPSIQDFFRLLCNTRDCGCKDPRDRIFALFSMGPKDLHQNLNIDYQHSTETVFTNAAMYLINSIGLDVLCGVEGRDESSTLPSWAPDWRIPVSSTPMMDLVDEAGSAGGRQHDQAFEFSYSRVWEEDWERSNSRQRVLETFGYHFGVVESVGDIFLPDRSNLSVVIGQGWKDFSSWHEDVNCKICHGNPGASCTTEEATLTSQKIAGENVPKLLSVTLRQTFFRTLRMDAKNATSWGEKHLEALQSSSDEPIEGLKGPISQDAARQVHWEIMVDAWEKLNDELTAESFPFTKRKRIYSCCTGRRLSMIRGSWETGPTKTFIGLVPAQTQREDEIFIIRGARCPFVLRRERGHCIMVGPCFVWEAMDRRYSRVKFEKIHIW
ncbi:hypothetical protein CEP51_008751 [Fusarium floridanum]|uniref:Heterokaryon incompatibility domain-containing protein n=1 Tax=Fusarium floridanum TaxID=1325733 RepID=A0A428RJV9_9HYPO|nr:hypothetical protein CEP51_008751 [Fusarium floridanum]